MCLHLTTQVFEIVSEVLKNFWLQRQGFGVFATAIVAVLATFVRNFPQYQRMRLNCDFNLKP